MSFTFKVKGLDDFSRALKKSPQTTLKVTGHMLRRAGQEVQAKSRREAPVDTSRLKSSIGWVVKKTSVRIGPSAKYGLFVEEGTKPHFPPPVALKSWARKRGLNEYAVAKSIAKKGTKAQPFMGPGLKKSEKKIQKIFTEGLETILKILSR